MKGVLIEYTTKQLEWVKLNSKLPRREMCEAFNKLFNRNINIANLSSLCQRNKWLTGRNGQYIKGNIRHPDSGAKGPNKASFKKGQVPKNLKPVGYERVNVYGYTEIKVAEGIHQFRPKHHVIWEKHYGKIPDGMIVRFKDNDRKNFDPNNFDLVSKHENLLLNKVDYAHEIEQLKPTIREIVRLEHKVHELTKNTIG